MFFYFLFLSLYLYFILIHANKCAAYQTSPPRQLVSVNRRHMAAVWLSQPQSFPRLDLEWSNTACVSAFTLATSSSLASTSCPALLPHKLCCCSIWILPSLLLFSHPLTILLLPLVVRDVPYLARHPIPTSSKIRVAHLLGGGCTMF